MPDGQYAAQERVEARRNELEEQLRQAERTGDRALAMQLAVVLAEIEIGRWASSE